MPRSAPTASPPDCRSTSGSSNPDVGTANYTTNSLISRYDGLQIDLRRRFSKGLLMSANYSFSRTVTSDFSTIHQPLAIGAEHQRRAAVGQVRGLLGSAVRPWPCARRGQSGWLNALAGGWNVSGVAHAQSGAQCQVGRHQAGRHDAEGLQTVFKIRRRLRRQDRLRPAAGHHRQHDQGVQLQRHGYTQGAPTGRYMAPASQAGCVEVYRGDCGEPRYINLTGPIVARAGSHVQEEHQTRARAPRSRVRPSQRVQGDSVQPRCFQASASATINQVTSAYTNNNTDDPGGRLGQVVVRFVW